MYQMQNGTGGFEDVEEVVEFSEEANCSVLNGTMITLLVAAIPIVALCVIILGFKICYKVCPQGQRSRTEFHLPRRISEFSTSTMFSISRASSIHQMPQIPGQSGGHHSQLHHVQPIIHHHHHHYPPTVRTDGTPLVAIELETINEQNGMDMESELDQELEKCSLTFGTEINKH